MRLRDLLDDSVVRVSLQSRDKKGCIQELIQLLVRAGRLASPDAALDAVLRREAQESTGIGHGVAVPHAKHSSIQTITAALGISAAGIDFDSVDRAPVHLVFLLLAHENEPGPHVRALAEISRLIRTPGVYQRITGAKSPGEVLAILDAEE